MTFFICQSEFDTSVEHLFAFHEEPQGFDSLVAMDKRIEIIQKPKSIQIGEVAILRVPILFQLKSNWIAEHTQYEKNKLFVDTQKEGPFVKFEHHHKFKMVSDKKSILTDQIQIDFHFWPISKWFILPVLKKQFKERHQVTAERLKCNHHLVFCGYSVSVID